MDGDELEVGAPPDPPPAPPEDVLGWHNLRYVIHRGDRRRERTILSGNSGIARPGRLLGVLGPSGSGKTILMIVLAGKLTTEETVFGWEEYGAAHTALHAGGSVGKVLVAGPVADNLRRTDSRKVCVATIENQYSAAGTRHAK